MGLEKLDGVPSRCELHVAGLSDPEQVVLDRRSVWLPLEHARVHYSQAGFQHRLAGFVGVKLAFAQFEEALLLEVLELVDELGGRQHLHRAEQADQFFIFLPAQVVAEEHVELAQNRGSHQNHSLHE